MDRVVSPILRITDLSVQFGGLWALDSVTLSVGGGERRAVIGPNGAGKTTLFNVIGGAIKPTGGQILLRDADITGLAPNRIRRSGISRAFQTPSVFPALSVRDNVWLGALFNHGSRWNPFVRMSNMTGSKEQVEELASRVGLNHRLNELAGNLSHAEQKLLDIAIALGSHPDVVLLDEPTQGVSPDEVERITSVIGDGMQEVTVVMIEHNVAAMLEIATYVTVLSKGAVIAEGSPADVVNNDEVQSIYLGEEFVAGEW